MHPYARSNTQGASLPSKGASTAAHCRRLVTLTSLLLPFLVTVSSCTGDGGRSPDAASASPRPPMECETAGFPCTWGEVSDEAERRGRAVAVQAVEAILSGSSVEQVSRTLMEEPDMVEVVFGDDALRFRVEGGRPEWVFDSTSALTLGGLSLPDEAGAVAAAAFPAAALDPVGKPKKGKPWKRALLLSPYAWQWALHQISDETDSIARLMALPRDYTRGGGVEVRRTALVIGTGGPAFSTSRVGVDDFKGWADYELIHISTHGTTVCDRLIDDGAGGYQIEVLNPCHTMLKTSEPWVGVNPKSAAGMPITTPSGIARSWSPLPGNIASDVKALFGDTMVGPSSLGNGDYVGPIQGVTNDFFIEAYPHGLGESILFLSACKSGEESALVQHLAGSKATVIGWSTDVPVEEAAAAATCFWRAMLGHGKTASSNDFCGTFLKAIIQKNHIGPYSGGATIQDAFEVIGELMGDANAMAAMGVSAGVTLGGPVTGAIAGGTVGPTGNARNRAIEIVRLVAPNTDIEIVDSTTIDIGGVAGDGVPDTLLAEIEVFGLGPTDDPDAMTVYVAIDGVRQSQSHSLIRHPAPERARTAARLTLDIDLVPGDSIDVEVGIDYPDGTSRWLYENLRYDYAWRADVGLGPYAGTYRGGDAEGWWGPDGLMTLSFAGRQAGPAPYIHVNFYTWGLGLSGPGTYTPPSGTIELNFSRTPASVDPAAELYYVNHGGPDRRPASMSLTAPPDPRTSSPISLVFEELSEQRVKGQASGPFYHLATGEKPGYEHPAATQNAFGHVTIDFDFVPCSDSRHKAGRC